MQQLRLASGHPLHPYVHSFWRMDGAPHGRRETVLPHGNVDLLFNLEAPLTAVALSGTAPILRAAPYVAGLQTRALDTVSTARVDLLGVSLRAERAAAVLRLPASELTDATVDASLLFRDAGGLYGALKEAPSFARQCGLLAAWLIRALAPERRSRLVGPACELLAADDSEAGAAGAARALGVSPRHLRRLFLDAVGVAPSDYIRLARFTRALGLVRGGGSLTAIAQAAQYYDHAHFCRDFRAIAGMTPSDYRQRCHTGPIAEVLVAACPSDTRQPPPAPLLSL
jgi:AraC-like DNA-binding protein